MSRRVLSSLVALACVLAVEPQGGRAERSETQMVMPDALAALERMGEHLKTLNQFTLSAETTSEDVLDYGEKVMIGGNITYHVRSPDRLRLDITTDKRERHYFYNGKTVTVYAPAMKFYSTFQAPDTARRTRAISSRPSTSAIRWSTERSVRTTPTARRRQISRFGFKRTVTLSPAKLSETSPMIRLGRNIRPC